MSGWTIRGHLITSILVPAATVALIVGYGWWTSFADVNRLLLVIAIVALLAVLNGIAAYRRAEWVKRDEQARNSERRAR